MMFASPSRTAILHARHVAHVRLEGNRLFRVLLPAQWIALVLLALVLSPFTYAGTARWVHPHVWTALVGGAALSAAPWALMLTRPDAALTRHVVTVAQILFSGLFIHVMDGRIETHFHVFGSLAFIAFYRDPWLLVTATMAVSVDHLGRTWLWPATVYGVPDPAWWRFLEHASWVVFENIVLAMGIRRSLADLHRIAERESALTHVNDLVEQQVDERTAELAASREQYRSLIETTQAIPWELDVASGLMTYVGPRIEAMLGYPPERFAEAGFFASLVHPDDRAALERINASITQPQADLESELRLVAADGRVVHTRSLFAAMGRPDRLVLRGISIDISRQKHLEAEARVAQRIQSLGRVAASVAHEVNTPLQYIGDNARFLADATRRLLHAVDRVVATTAPALDPETRRKLDDALRSAKVELIRSGLEGANGAVTDGLQQVRQIVRALQAATTGPASAQGSFLADECVRTATLLVRAEFPELAYDVDLGEAGAIVGDGSVIGQAVLGLIRNAAEATREHLPLGSRGTIEIRSRRIDDRVEIEIRDHAGGIAETIRPRLFEPFFTTRGEGHGTGEGLHRIRDIIETQHGGEIVVRHEGDGTTFVVVLPGTVPLAA